jgi:hypothetical protein
LKKRPEFAGLSHQFCRYCKICAYPVQEEDYQDDVDNRDGQTDRVIYRGLQQDQCRTMDEEKRACDMKAPRRLF